MEISIALDPSAADGIIDSLQLEFSNELWELFEMYNEQSIHFVSIKDRGIPET